MVFVKMVRVEKRRYPNSLVLKRFKGHRCESEYHSSKVPLGHVIPFHNLGNPDPAD